MAARLGDHLCDEPGGNEVGEDAVGGRVVEQSQVIALFGQPRILQRGIRARGAVCACLLAPDEHCAVLEVEEV